MEIVRGDQNYTQTHTHTHTHTQTDTHIHRHKQTHTHGGPFYVLFFCENAETRLITKLHFVTFTMFLRKLTKLMNVGLCKFN